MGAAMGQNPEILEEVCGWVMGAATKPVWAKMTPNITRIEDPSRAALRAGCHGLSAINTIRSVTSVNLETLRPEPTVEGYTTPGGYSSQSGAADCVAHVHGDRHDDPARVPGADPFRHGRHREAASDAAQFILLGERHGAGVYGRDEIRLRVRPADVRGIARLHGKARVRDAGGFQRKEPRLLHDARGVGTHAGRQRKPRKKPPSPPNSRRRWCSPTANGAATASCNSPTRWRGGRHSSTPR